MRKKWFSMGVIMLVVVSMLFIGACKEAGPTPPTPEVGKVKIAILGPMTHFIGQTHWQGASLAAKEINAAGGVKVGDKQMLIELGKFDTNEYVSVPDASTAAERALGEGYKIFQGVQRSEAVWLVMDIAADNKVLFVQSGSLSLEQTDRVRKEYDRYKYYFRVSHTNSFWIAQSDFARIEYIKKIMKEELGIEKPRLALIAEKAAWTEPIIKFTEAECPKRGIDYIGTWSISPLAEDVTAELTAIRAKEPHILYYQCSGPAGIPVLTGYGELKMPAVAVGLAAQYFKKDFMELTRGLGDYVCGVNLWAPVEITPKTIPFWNAYEKEYDDYPYVTAAIYDAVYILKEAIERAGTLDNDAIVKELEKTDHPGTYGRFVFDEGHDIKTGPGYVTTIAIQWRGGKVYCVWPPPDGSWEGVVYKGSTKLELPPWMVEYYKAK